MAEELEPANPLQLTPKEIQMVESMSGYGMPMEKIAAILGMSKDTLETRVKKDATLRSAVLRGRAVAEHNVTKTAYDQAIAGNTTMLIFWLKCRARWKDTTKIEVTGENGGPLQMDVSTKRSIREIIKDPEALKAIEILEERLQQVPRLPSGEP